MDYRRYEDKIVLRLDSGEELTEKIREISEKEGIKLASLQGIGASDNFTVGVFDIDTKKYHEFHHEEFHEILNLTGTINTKDGEHYSHMHITLAGQDGTVVGGHVLKVVTKLTMEIVITIINGEIGRKLYEPEGINRLDF